MEKLSHVDAAGQASMVNVGEKSLTARVAIAEAIVQMLPATLQAIRANAIAKGDVLAVARIAGIQAAKRTDTLIPLCHSLPLDAVAVEFDLRDEHIVIKATTHVTARTGVEMEAMVAASVAALTLYDMCKAIDRGIVIEQVRLLHKRGGKSGEWNADDTTPSAA